MLAGFARWIGFLTMAAGATGALLRAFPTQSNCWPPNTVNGC
jgi:hypothetical protein